MFLLNLHLSCSLISVFDECTVRLSVSKHLIGYTGGSRLVSIPDEYNSFPSSSEV